MPYLSPWNDERDRYLRVLWDQGLTTAKIAIALGLHSKNQVIGRAHRLQLPARPNPFAKRAGCSAAPSEAPPASNTSPPLKVAGGVPFIRLTPPPPKPAPRPVEAKMVPQPPPPKPPIYYRNCRFPAWGDKEAPSHIYCEAPVALGAYCAKHAKLCYTPSREQLRAAAREGS